MIVQLANMLPNIRFVVVCLNNQVKEDELPINIHLWGAAKNREELASLYSAANVTLVLSKRETYSMVTAESLCCGTPVVGFLAGGPESIAIEKFSTFVEYGDLNAIKEAIGEIERYRKDMITEHCTGYEADIEACSSLIEELSEWYGYN